MNSLYALCAQKEFVITKNIPNRYNKPFLIEKLIY